MSPVQIQKWGHGLGHKCQLRSFSLRNGVSGLDSVSLVAAWGWGGLSLVLSWLSKAGASCVSGPAGRPPPLRMSHCSSRALTLLSSVFGACGLLLVGIAVSTDYWLYMEEGTVLPQNQTTEVKMALHAGLWRVCFFAGTDPTCPPFNCPCFARDPRVLIHSPNSWVPETQKLILFLSWRRKFLPGDLIPSPLFPDPKVAMLTRSPNS